MRVDVGGDRAVEFGGGADDRIAECDGLGSFVPQRLVAEQHVRVPQDWLFTDPRVTRYWDNDRTLGTWFADHGLGDQPILWDAYVLFDDKALWNDTPLPVTFGEPLIGDGAALDNVIAVYIDVQA